MAAFGSSITALRDAAAIVPQLPFLRIAGDEFSFAEAYELTRAVGAALVSLGVEPGDRVAVMSENRAEAAWTWLGANAIGAIDVPLNTGARGHFLNYIVRDADPRVIVGTRQHMETLAGAGVVPETAVLLDHTGARPFGHDTRHLGFAEFLALSDDPLDFTPSPGDVASLLYTSGTTGPSKGVMVPQGHWPNQGELLRDSLGVRTGEVVYCAQPLFHQDGRTFIQIALAARSMAVIAERFSVSRFWDDIRRNDVDVFGSIGTMMWLLYKQAVRADDADHPARMVGSSAVPAEIHRAFEKRFGVLVHQWYGQTETGCVTATFEHGARPGSIGRPTRAFDVKVVDEVDNDAARGSIGELCCRPRQANVMMRGYWGQPEATITSWQNLWFHTGDLVRIADDGEFEFVGRKKDAIRRRGENVSAWEVEQAASRHDAVSEAAAFGVPSPLGEEEVALLVVTHGESSVEPAALHAFMSASLPYFAVPRFIEFVDRLPKTPSERIEKAQVRERGLTAAAWDACEA